MSKFFAPKQEEEVVEKPLEDRKVPEDDEVKKELTPEKSVQSNE